MGVLAGERGVYQNVQESKFKNQQSRSAHVLAVCTNGKCFLLELMSSCVLVGQKKGVCVSCS